MQSSCATVREPRWHRTGSQHLRSRLQTGGSGCTRKESYEWALLHLPRSRHQLEPSQGQVHCRLGETRTNIHSKLGVGVAHFSGTCDAGSYAPPEVFMRRGGSLFMYRILIPRRLHPMDTPPLANDTRTATPRMIMYRKIRIDLSSLLSKSILDCITSLDGLNLTYFFI